jgi:DNA-binding transcriptional LysR family regulator
MENLRHAARRIGREPRVKFSVNTVEAARSLISAGLGIALQPASLLVLDERDRVTLVNVDGAWAERSHRVGKLRDKTLSPSAEGAHGAAQVSAEGRSRRSAGRRRPSRLIKR